MFCIDLWRRVWLEFLDKGSICWLCDVLGSDLWQQSRRLGRELDRSSWRLRKHPREIRTWVQCQKFLHEIICLGCVLTACGTSRSCSSCRLHWQPHRRATSCTEQGQFQSGQHHGRQASAPEGAESPRRTLFARAVCISLFVRGSGISRSRRDQSGLECDPDRPRVGLTSRRKQHARYVARQFARFEGWHSASLYFGPRHRSPRADQQSWLAAGRGADSLTKGYHATTMFLHCFVVRGITGSCSYEQTIGVSDSFVLASTAAEHRFGRSLLSQDSAAQFCVQNLLDFAVPWRKPEIVEHSCRQNVSECRS